MPRETNVGFKVGLFVLLAIIGLTVFIFSITDSSIFAEGKSFKVIFEFSNGLKKSAPVRIAGVDEGTVKDINLFFDVKDGKMKVDVALWVKKDVQLPTDSVATINQLGLMGEKYVEIIPGSSRTFLNDGQSFIGQDPVSQEEISQKVLEVANKLDMSIAGFNKIINDEQNLNSINTILNNLSKSSSDLTLMIQDVKSGKGTVGKLLFDEGLYQDLKGMSYDLKENPCKLLYRPRKSK
jgi:phospholipid/cholesterol/gamma-HCH transport system substrate-binding protein